MKINEIFYSISGESFDAGRPAVFVRTFSCPLRCAWCDSMYAVEGNDFTDMSVDQIIEKVKSFRCSKVILTGGEPMIQLDFNKLLDELVQYDFDVEIETSGAVDLRSIHVESSKYIVTMDWKCSSSGMTDKMLFTNLGLLHHNDVLKCVVGSHEDLEEMKRVSEHTSARVYVSPVFGMIEPKDIVEYLLKEQLPNVRLQLQLHKYIWPSDMRGV